MTDWILSDGAGEERGSGPGRVTAEFEWGGDPPPSVVVLETLAEASGRSIESFDPLYDHVDVDALDSLFRPLEDGRPRGSGRVTFYIDGYRASVHGDGLVAVEPADDRQ